MVRLSGVVHELKIWPDEIRAVMAGYKRFEYRKNDRDYHIGDYLKLREWYPAREEYGDLSICVEVTWITKTGFGLPDGYCVMSVKPVDPVFCVK